MTQSSPCVKWHTKAATCVKLWCRQFCPRVSYLVPAWGCVSPSDNFLRNESSERVVRQKFARTRWRQFCQLPITMCLMWWPTFVWFQDRSATFSRSKIFTHLDFVSIINDNHYKTTTDCLLCFMSNCPYIWLDHEQNCNWAKLPNKSITNSPKSLHEDFAV